jgi:hypothetical protein
VAASSRASCENASALLKSLDATLHFFIVLVPATADVAEFDGKLAGYKDHVFAPIARISFCPAHPLPRKQALVHTGLRWYPSSTRAVNRRETQPCVDSGKWAEVARLPITFNGSAATLQSPFTTRRFSDQFFVLAR